MNCLLVNWGLSRLSWTSGPPWLSSFSCLPTAELDTSQPLESCEPTLYNKLAVSQLCIFMLVWVQTHTPEHSDTGSHKHPHTLMCTQTHIRINTHIYTLPYIQVHTHMLTYTQMHTHINIHRQVHTYIYSDIYTSTHTLIHTHINTHTHTHLWLLSSPKPWLYSHVSWGLAARLCGLASSFGNADTVSWLSGLLQPSLTLTAGILLNHEPELSTLQRNIS